MSLLTQYPLWLAIFAVLLGVGPYGNTYFSASNPDTGTLGYFTFTCEEPAPDP